MAEDRVCMHYVVDRLEDILDAPADDIGCYHDQMVEALDKFKRELIYNLGANQRSYHKEHWLPDELKS